MPLPRVVASAITVGLVIWGGNTVCAQDYPNKPIRIITTGVGGGGDFTARLIAQAISGPLGQQVVVDNRPSGVIPGQVVSQAAPDGYTLLVTGGIVWIIPLLQKAPYDPVRDFSPVTMTDTSPNILALHPSVPVKTVKELIALAKARPGDLNYASVGTGGPSHLAGELFKSMAGVDIVRVPYKGGGPAVVDLVGGQVQVMFATPTAAMPHVKSGRLKALAVTSSQPSTLFPALPTVAASGLPGFEAVSVTCIFAPARTPDAIIRQLNQEIVRAVKTAEAKERFISIVSEVVGSTPEQLAATMKSDIARWGKVIKDAGITAD